MVLTALFIIHYTLFISPSRAQVGTWRSYLAYHDVQQIQAASGDDLFVLASNNLYQYNKAEQSIVTYDKINGLSDTYITHIRWCPQAKRLVAVYGNTNIDLVETNGNVINISDLYTKAITGDKTVNSIYINDQYAYLACGFGIVKLNVKNAEIAESYIFNHNIQDVAISNNYLYAKLTDTKTTLINDTPVIPYKGNINIDSLLQARYKTESITYYIKAPLTANLIDKSNWENVFEDLSSLFTKDNSDYDDNIETVKTLQPGGPKYNHFYNMLVHNGNLYTAGGGWYQFGNFNRPGTVQVLNSNRDWNIFQDDMTPAFATYYRDANAIAIDPLDSKHVMVATCSGIYEFTDGVFLHNYTAGNTDYFESATSQNPQYVRTDGILYDADGNLYCLNSGSSTAIIKRSTDGTWSGFMDNSLIDKPDHAMRGMKGSILDSRGYIWFVNCHSANPAFFRYDPQNNTIVKYSKFINQDGTLLTNLYYVNCVCEDLEGNIWVGTEVGPVYLTTAEIDDNSLGVIQHKVPRNDGTNYADYLLSGIGISCMAIDKAGRKWFGTSGNGIYLISADNNTQLQHFTAENSYLLSDNIESIAINDETGEVFIGTESGLCSYVSDATTANEEMTTDNVWAYPNPVYPDYTGLITVKGLSFNADVKILNASGKLIAEGKSNGGSFTWDGCDKDGSRVASGVYMVLTAKSDGTKGTVCKIAVIR